MKSRFNILVAGITLVIATGPAAAAFKIATYSGTLSSGTDQTGVFGTVGQDLTGLGYVITYTYDYGSGGVQITFPDYFLSYGGTSLHTSSPIVDSSVTINGVSKHISGKYYGGLSSSPQIDKTYISYGAAYARYEGAVFVNNTIANVGLDPVGIIPFENDVVPTVRTVNGSIRFARYSGKIPDLIYESAGANFSGSAVYSVSDTNIGAVSSNLTGEVPEPASWAMLIAGFGLVGASLRRNRMVRLA